jgi:hypothetical protein
LFKKANKQLLKLILAILQNEYFCCEAGENIQIGDVTASVESFDIDSKFLFACGDNPMEQMNPSRAFFLDMCNVFFVKL